MADDVEIPKVGKLPKKVLIPLAVGLAGFVAWRFWQARNGAGADAEASTITDGDFGAVDTSIPGVLNPFPDSFSGGGTSATTTTTGDRDGDGIIGPGEFTNNGQWTDYVVNKLTASDTWSYTDIVTALGNGLAGRPTSDVQQAILRSAVAVGGNPPVGTITIVAGGNTDLTIAPSGVSATAAETTAVVNFTGVSGATSYQVFRSDVSSPVGAGTSSPITVGGLSPNRTYSFTVAGVTSTGSVGPKSSAASATTKAYAMAKPAAPSVSSITTTGAVARVPAVAHADEFYWYLNGAPRGSTQGVQLTLTGLKSKTKYTLAAQARGFGQPAGPMGPTTTFTTK